MQTNFVYEDYTGRIEFVPGLNAIRGRCVVYAYEHIKQGKQPNGTRLTSPKVLVVLKQIRDDRSLGTLHKIEVKITYLSLLRIGTVLENGRCIGFSNNLLPFETELDQTEGKWKLVTKNEYLEGFNSTYPLRTQNNSYYIEFTQRDGYKVLIPCLTYFSACYGFSAELKRILVTYHWDEVLRRICGPVDSPMVSNRLVVNLPKRLVDDDATFVAHVLYDNFAQLAAKRLYSQIDTSLSNDKAVPVFLQVTPWFTDAMRVELRGVWLTSTVFLGLAFEGISEPDGNPISLGRANQASKSTGDGPATAWANTLRPIHNLPLLVLDSDYDPAPDEPPVEVVEPRLRILGHRRARKKVVMEESQYSSGRKIDKPSSGVGTTGERQPGDTKISPLTQVPNLQNATSGTLVGMWKASKTLQAAYPELIQRACWYVMEGKYSSENEPILISLDDYTEAEKEVLTDEQKRWIYSSYSQRKLRGILVIQLDLSGTSYVIVELERKHGASPHEEHIKGLVFEKPTEYEFDDLIQKLRARLKNEFGNINRTVSLFKNAATFNHPASTSHDLKCQRAVINALNKMGVSPDIIRTLKSGLAVTDKRV